MKKIIIICGPTAVGKTAVSIEMARRFGGEIVSADSQQVWRGFDIGTAKADLAERSDVPHHLIDIVDRHEHFDAARFVAAADAAIADIVSRKKVPFVVGGTGMFLQMLLHGICEVPQCDEAYRQRLEADIDARGLDALHELHAKLGEVDPESGRILHPNDRTRIVRALEIHHLTGQPASVIRREHAFKEDRYDALKLGLTIDRAELYARIDARVDRMLTEGLVDEVRALLQEATGDEQPFRAVGYREIVAFLRDEMPFEEAVRLTKRNSRRFAKRQLTWLRSESQLRWFDPVDVDGLGAEIATFLG